MALLLRRCSSTGPAVRRIWVAGPQVSPYPCADAISTSHMETIIMTVRSIVLEALAALLLGFQAHGQQGKHITITGTVHDENGSPLPLVNVQVEGTHDGDATDLNGRFSFASAIGSMVTLRASLVGYDPATVNLLRPAGDSMRVVLVLRETVVRMEECVVAASAFTISDDTKALAVRTLDVVTTPGAAADVLHAIQTLPGVCTVDEGAGLYVRGGDVSETTMLLDQATVVHPYKFESSTGGYFGTIPPMLLGGTFFSSGGFTARYGNALSGVLAMETMNMPSRLSSTLGISLAAGSAGAAVPIIPDVLGFRISGNTTFSDAMFRLNGSRDRFTIPPDGADINALLIYKYSPVGQVKLFTLLETSRIGAHAHQASFGGIYESREQSRLFNLQWSSTTATSLLKGSLSFSRFAADRTIGNMDLLSSDIMLKARFDVQKDLGPSCTMAGGIEAENTVNEFTGTIPRNPSVLDPAAATYLLDERYAATRIGGYAELTTLLMPRLAITTGLRMDEYSPARQTALDPRLSLRYEISNTTHAQCAWGIYHQFPQPYLYNDVNGNPHLTAQRAIHWIASLESTSDLFQARFEVFRKSYANMVLRTSPSGYNNAGDGVASGIDVFLKYGAFLRTPVSGWISYGYLSSQRVQVRDLAQTIVYENAPTPYDITHNLTVVCKAQVVSLLSLAFTFRYATGLPVTPIVGAIRSDRGEYYEPVEGNVNAERLPDFIRLDATLAYFQPFGEANAATFYIAVTNLLNRPNPVAYEYSQDYTERRLRTTDYRRFIYFGLSLSLGTLGIGD
jgi:vitamin B12 transporter